MKRIAILILSILYLIPSVGVAMDLHKCGKKIRAISINAPHKSRCPCGTKMPAGCCKDFHLSLKIVDSQQESKCILIQAYNHFIQVDRPVNLILGETHSHFEIFDFSSYHAPPFKIKLPVYLVNSVFLV